MMCMGLTLKKGGFGEKTLQNVAFVIFLPWHGITERVLRRYHQRHDGLFTFQKERPMTAGAYTGHLYIRGEGQYSINVSMLFIRGCDFGEIFVDCLV